MTSEPQPQLLDVGEGETARRIAVLHEPGSTPGLFWMGGFMSDMAGTKAERLAEFARQNGRASTRFDYSGHGRSEGRFTDGTIGRWLEESLAVFDRFTRGEQIVIGSSMGGWLALLLTEAHRARIGNGESRIRGLVLLAPAVDMTEQLMWANYSEEIRREILEDGAHAEPSDYSEDPYVITRELIEEGRRHLFGERPIVTGCPVHILQGVADRDVPWQHAVDLIGRLAEDDVVLTLVKNADHRLSSEADLARLVDVVSAM